MPDSQHAGVDLDGPRLAGLLAWRQQLIDSGAVSKTGFKETHLRLILRSGRTDLDQLRAMLPGSVADHAESLAALLAAAADPAPPPAAPRHAAAAPVIQPGDGAQQTPVPPDLGARTPLVELPLSAEDFAVFPASTQTGQTEPISIGLAGDGGAAPGGRRLGWPTYLPAAGGGQAVVIYRLVSADDSAPHTPDRARLVAATTDTSVVDDQPVDTGMRHYQVWVNAGPTRADALAAQPIKHAERVAVGAVRDCAVYADGGRVIGSWRVPSGVSSVFIFRVPAQDVIRERPEHRILAGQDNLTGFVDVDAQPGQHYVYRIRAAVTAAGVVQLSEPVDAAVEVAAILQPVTDLSVTADQEAVELFELSWTAPPAGTVAIYRSQNAPTVAGDAAELAEAALEQVGLSADMRLGQPVVDRSDPQGQVMSVMRGVAWPPDWNRAYFTPVTVVSGRAVVGRSSSTVRTGVISDVDLAEYCNKQVLTFNWPEGAAAVVVYQAPKGYDARNGLTGTSFEISSEEYDRYGGLQLPNGKLPLTGCSLHLVPVAFSAGRRVTGAVHSIEYAGLLRLQYTVQLARDAGGAPSHAKIYLRSQVELPGSPAFVLVNNTERIPLAPTDGEALDAAPLDAEGRIAAKPSKELRWSALSTSGADEVWAADLRGRRGWIRLFVNAQSAQRLSSIALLDPPVPALRLSEVQQ